MMVVFTVEICKVSMQNTVVELSVVTEIVHVRIRHTL